ncbi:MAG: DUF1653 domain-containing protein [Lachnospiraceae bacterium]|nr:DUF1653 domain-containing protein [Lachnospiraceae bacterium]
MEPKAFEIYRHFKGNLYQVMMLAEEEGTGNMLVVYQGLYAPFKVYARPLSNFLERLDPMKYPGAAQVYRFERVTDIETVTASSAEMPGESVALSAPPETLLQGQDSTAFENNPATMTEEIFTASTEEIPTGKSVQTAPEVDMMKTSVQTAPEADMAETAGGINPDLLLVLDAREPEEKLDALFRIKNRLTPDMLTVIEMSQGMEPQETWSIEERYKHIKNDIITKQKYEQKRI